VFAPLAKFIDWSVLEMLKLVMRPDRGACSRLERVRLQEAVEFLNGPDFIPNDSAPAPVEFHNGPPGLHFSFPSPRPNETAENNLVYGRLYRVAGRWQERPAVLLIHGGADSYNHRFGFPWIARGCNRAGANAVTMELPDHFQRRPRRREAVTQIDYVFLSRIVAQAVADIRSLAGWLLTEGCPNVTLWGISYGAWLAGMIACRDARINSVVMMAPPDNLLVRAEEMWWVQIQDTKEELEARCKALNGTPLKLASCQPVVRRENVLLIHGDYDLFVGNGPMEIWEGWGRPEIWYLPHGHIGVGSGMVPGLTQRTIHWLTTRLGKA